MCVCGSWKVQEGLVLTEYIVAVNIFVVTYLIRVVACGDLCKRFPCMVVQGGLGTTESNTSEQRKITDIHCVLLVS